MSGACGGGLGLESSSESDPPSVGDFLILIRCSPLAWLGVIGGWWTSVVSNEANSTPGLGRDAAEDAVGRGDGWFSGPRVICCGVVVVGC